MRESVFVSVRNQTLYIGEERVGEEKREQTPQGERVGANRQKGCSVGTWTGTEG